MITNNNSKSLRGIAILIVLASHFAGWMYTEPVFATAKNFVSALGPYGVDIFFAVSGYGLVKSANNAIMTTGKNPITVSFVERRIMTVYVPYLLIIGILNCIDGTFASGHVSTVIHYLLGTNYWFMCVLFILYIAFMLIWRLGHLRYILISIVVVGLTAFLYHIRMRDFWELSNLAFLIGIYAAGIESRWPDVMYKKNVIKGLLLTGITGMIITGAGLWYIRLGNPVGGFAWRMALGVFFTLTIVASGYMLPNSRWKIVGTIGDNTLFIYLLNAPLFWALIFRFEELGYASAAIITGLITILSGVVIGSVYSWLMKKLGIIKKN